MLACFGFVVAGMDTERWRKIEDLFHAAAGMAASERHAFLKRACTTDEQLRREVGSLLDCGDESSDRLDSPMWNLIVREVTKDDEHPFAGALVSHYKLLERIGEGGMGVLYKAEDTNLGRPVALKFLAGPNGHASAAMERLRREARVAFQKIVEQISRGGSRQHTYARELLVLSEAPAPFVFTTSVVTAELRPVLCRLPPTYPVNSARDSV